MSEQEWKDPRLARLLFPAPKAPTAFETEAFVSRAMGRIEQARRPALAFLLECLAGRWTVPALGLGIATLLMSVLFAGRASPLSLTAAIGPDSAPAEWVLPVEDAP